MIEGYITITIITITFIITSSLVKLFVCNVKKKATDDDVINQQFRHKWSQ